MIARERYGWYRGHGLDYDEGTWQWLEQAAGPDTPIDGTVADGEMLDLGGISVEIVALPGHSPGHLGVVHRESAHGDRDGRGARARPLHDRRRADQPTAVRVGRRPTAGPIDAAADAPPGPARHEPLRAGRGRRGGRRRSSTPPRRSSTISTRASRAELAAEPRAARALLARRGRRRSARSARWRSSSRGRSAAHLDAGGRGGARGAPRRVRTAVRPGRPPERRGAT